MIAAAPGLLGAGDFVLMPGGAGYRFCSAVDVPSTDAFSFFPAVPAGETTVLNGGSGLSGLDDYFGLEGMHAELLLGMLPSVVQIRAATNKAA